jgi:hypothetical protein
MAATMAATRSPPHIGSFAVRPVFVARACALRLLEASSSSFFFSSFFVYNNTLKKGLAAAAAAVEQYIFI